MHRRFLVAQLTTSIQMAIHFRSLHQHCLYSLIHLACGFVEPLRFSLKSTYFVQSNHQFDFDSMNLLTNCHSGMCNRRSGHFVQFTSCKVYCFINLLFGFQILLLPNQQEQFLGCCSHLIVNFLNPLNLNFYLTPFFQESSDFDSRFRQQTTIHPINLGAHLIQPYFY